MDVTIREANGDADLARVLAVRNAIEVEQLTVAGLHAERSAATAALDLIAVAGGTDVAAGSVAGGR